MVLIVFAIHSCAGNFSYVRIVVKTKISEKIKEAHNHGNDDDTEDPCGTCRA